MDQDNLNEYKLYYKEIGERGSKFKDKQVVIKKAKSGEAAKQEFLEENPNCKVTKYVKIVKYI